MFLITYFLSRSQVIDKNQNPFGEGVVDIQEYAYPPGKVAPDFADTNIDTPFYNFTYYIKGLKILRKDVIDSSSLVAKAKYDTSKDKDAIIVTHLEVSIQHPSYLMDWNNRISYQFYTKDGKKFISKTLLKDNPYDLFYKKADSTRPKILLLGSKPKAIIDGKECFKGIIKTKDSTICTFYYTHAPSKVQSPLNSFVPKNFPYQVLCVKIPIDWTQLEGSKAKGTFIFQIDRLQEATLNESMFQLPKNTEIKENVSWQEMYSH